MADFEPKTWTADATDENVIRASDCKRWQDGVDLFGGSWPGSWEDGKDTLTAEQLNALETEINKFNSSFTAKTYSDGDIPGVDEWNRIEEGIVKTIEGHNWSITWEWAPGYKTCTATFTDVDTGDTRTISCTITSVVTEPTCTEQGYTEFTASATLDNVIYIDTAVGDYVPATGHQWSAPEWDWAEDYASCTATFTCTVCGDKDTVDCTVTEVEKGVYTATCTHDGTEYSDTVEILVAFAIYSDTDSSLTFYSDSEVPEEGGTYKGKNVTAVYTGFDTATYTSVSQVPWYSGAARVTSVTFDSSFKQILCISTAYWFYIAFSNATTWTGLDNLDTSEVTNMSNMFYGCSGLTTLDVSNFNTSSVTDMSNMFSYCSGLTTLDVSNFNTSSVTNMSRMFYSCSELTTLDVSNFDTAKVTSMSYMFAFCYSLTTIYSDDSKFVTAKVTSGDNMFTNCSKLVGGNGTTYSSSNVTYTMAHVDTADNPGYFTAK